MHCNVRYDKNNLCGINFLMRLVSDSHNSQKYSCIKCHFMAAQYICFKYVSCQVSTVLCSTIPSWAVPIQTLLLLRARQERSQRVRSRRSKPPDDSASRWWAEPGGGANQLGLGNMAVLVLQDLQGKKKKSINGDINLIWIGAITIKLIWMGVSQTGFAINKVLSWE